MGSPSDIRCMRRGESPLRRPWFLFVLASAVALPGSGCDNSSGDDGAPSGPGTGGAGGSGGTQPGDGSAGGPPVAKHILVDQFGYLPQSDKIAVIREPRTGYDNSDSFTPGAMYALVDAASGSRVFSAAPAAWNSGAEDASSGDVAWWFDFSQVTASGDYYVLDVDRSVRSFEFSISDFAYRDVLKQAVRTFFYQRAGQAKDVRYAGAAWADGASHVGPLQDHHCRLYNQASDAATEKDLWGGWYDAGDYNKYTNWTASYVIRLLHAYAQTPAAFTDDYGIPESGNGIPDIVDETKWGLDFLTRMQNSEGSILSIVGESSASPPSAATGPSLYGGPSTSATLSGAAAFAYGSKVYRSLGRPEMTSYADALRTQAGKAWAWAAANPNVLFRNNDPASGTQGLGAGQQETDDYGRLALKLEAAVYLFDATGDTAYRTFFDANYRQARLIANGAFVYPFEAELQEALLDYTKTASATTATVTEIRTAYRRGMDSADNFQAFRNNRDPYLAHLKDYTWGSNATKSNQGNMFFDIVTYGLDAAVNREAERAAERYLHYLHGVNPFALAYLSNMYEHGAENSVNEFYHSWFADKSPLWDRVGMSKFGPPAGFVTGGPNPTYDWDACCPSGCGSAANNAVCTSEALSPPKGQPPQKSYKDFNTSWPLDSWSVTENSNGYQVAYILLLSKFVK